MLFGHFLQQTLENYRPDLFSRILQPEEFMQIREAGMPQSLKECKEFSPISNLQGKIEVDLNLFAT